MCGGLVCGRVDVVAERIEMGWVAMWWRGFWGRWVGIKNCRFGK